MHVLPPGYNTGGTKKKLPDKKEGDNTGGVACTVLEQQRGYLVVADGDGFHQRGFIGPTNPQIDKPGIVKCLYDDLRALPMLHGPEKRPKPCQRPEQGDLTRTLHGRRRDSRDGVIIVDVGSEPRQEASPLLILDQRIGWFGHVSSDPARHNVENSLID